MRSHLPEEELHAYLDGQLSSSQRAEIAEHLLACLICRALEAEVRSLRDRSIALLAIATPAEIHGVPMPQRIRRRLVLRPAAAAAVALLAAASWLWTRPAGDAAESGPALATAFVAPAILARLTAPAPRETPVIRTVANRRNLTRSFTLASRAAMPPRVIPVRDVATTGQSNRLRAVDPMIEVAPSDDGAGWETATLEEARKLAAGSIAHLRGISVNAVRLQPSREGGRPTAMVRQLLPDGRVVWVVEGNTNDLGPVTRMLEASGLTLSSARRALPDYLGTDAQPVRTVRMVTVAAYLPIDSLEALAGARLKLE